MPAIKMTSLTTSVHDCIGPFDILSISQKLHKSNPLRLSAIIEQVQVCGFEIWATRC